MNEIAGPRMGDRFAFLAPTDFANTRKNVGNRLLLSVMMNISS